jgi:ABC-type antimicrobial peptide transport system permease subunit
MTVQELIDKNVFQEINIGDDTDRSITKPFCCDLLSIAMGRAPAGCAWVTVMGNLNTLAVAALADAACVILAEGAMLDEAALSFLGMGVQPPAASLGNMLNSAQSVTVLTKQPWLWIPPGLVIIIVVTAVNFVGDALRDAFDPLSIIKM